MVTQKLDVYIVIGSTGTPTWATWVLVIGNLVAALIALAGSFWAAGFGALMADELARRRDEEKERREEEKERREEEKERREKETREEKKPAVANAATNTTSPPAVADATTQTTPPSPADRVATLPPPSALRLRLAAGATRAAAAQ
ncbi:hypothetical protein F4778DRAFT_780154 [Xylariomycetidae sp. FL2044]|nr:hypothetical protein F4778DRAFT_780154 [Xylariomycetidae sp. FL2044]